MVRIEAVTHEGKYMVTFEVHPYVINDYVSLACSGFYKSFKMTELPY